MKDETARHASELARAVGRTDWWNVYLEHTDYEWLQQVAQMCVSPWGERRADLRMAHNTAAVIQFQHGLSGDAVTELRDALQIYLKCDELPVPEVTPNQAAQMWGGG